MEVSKWTDVMEALTSLGTAIFTAGSLIYLALYTRITGRAHEEGTRPVLILYSIQSEGSRRKAIYKNTGAGVAVCIERIGQAGLERADSNVLAPGGTLELTFPAALEPNILEVRYESLGGRRFCTVSSFSEDGRVFNEYVPNVSAVGDKAIKALYRPLLNSADTAYISALVEKSGKPSE